MLVPGGQWNARGEMGAWAETERGALPRAVPGLHEGSVEVTSGCTGGMLLARASLTTGGQRRLTAAR